MNPRRARNGRRHASLQGFVPKSLNGTVLWLRADRGITLNGSNVSAWADQTSNHVDFTQGTGARQPAYVTTGGPRSKPYVSFSGAATPTFLTSAALTLAQPFEWWFALRETGWGDTLRIIDGTVILYQRTISAKLALFVAASEFITGDLGLNTWRAFRGTWNGASSDSQVDSNGTPVSGALNAGGYAGGAITLGAAAGGSASSGAAFDVAEMVLYNRATTAAERAQLYAYFTGRYGTA